MAEGPRLNGQQGAVDGEAGIEFIRMSEEDAARLRWYVGYLAKCETRSHDGSETPSPVLQSPCAEAH